MRSKVAIANAKLAYERYQRIFSGPRWEVLAAKGAQTQRVLWASTSTKNPKLRDVLYIEELIGKDTVNTIPPATYDAFRDHGVPRASLTEDVEGARSVMANLEAAGISIDTVTSDLVTAGVKQFEDAFTKLLGRHAAAITSLTFSFPPDWIGRWRKTCGFIWGDVVLFQRALG